jgi:putative hydrolase of the HAD superfamily
MPVQYLLFDLDDTLYTDASGLFLEVRQRIVAWVSQALDISPEEAGALRDQYYHAYGTTMGGLLKHYPHVDIDGYLEAVHQVDVSRYLAPSPELAAMLTRLDAPKAVFTNAIASWAERVLRQLDVRDHFEAIVDVRAVDYHSKPSPQAYRRALDLLEVPGDVCVLVDDSEANLKGAAAFGMRTVLVRDEMALGNGVDYAVSHVLETEPILQDLLAEKI